MPWNLRGGAKAAKPPPPQQEEVPDTAGLNEDGPVSEIDGQELAEEAEEEEEEEAADRGGASGGEDEGAVEAQPSAGAEGEEVDGQDGGEASMDSPQEQDFGATISFGSSEKKDGEPGRRLGAESAAIAGGTFAGAPGGELDPLAALEVSLYQLDVIRARYRWLLQAAVAAITEAKTSLYEADASRPKARLGGSSGGGEHYDDSTSEAVQVEMKRVRAMLKPVCDKVLVEAARLQELVECRPEAAAALWARRASAVGRRSATLQGAQAMVIALTRALLPLLPELRALDPDFRTPAEAATLQVLERVAQTGGAVVTAAPGADGGDEQTVAATATAAAGVNAGGEGGQAAEPAVVVESPLTRTLGSSAF